MFQVSFTVHNNKMNVSLIATVDYCPNISIVQKW